MNVCGIHVEDRDVERAVAHRYGETSRYYEIRDEIRRAIERLLGEGRAPAPPGESAAPQAK